MNSAAFIQEAIRKCQSKSHFMMFSTLLMQTAGYGKAEDDLADSRIETLSGMRRDHATKAVREVVGMGLFEVAGAGKYGTVYRIPERFLGEDGYVGFPIQNIGQIGQSETDAYADYAETDQMPAQAPESCASDADAAYRNLADEHQQLLESNRILVNTNRELVETNRILVNRLPTPGEVSRNSVGNPPTPGEQPTNSRFFTHRELVTDIIKPLHNLTPTSPNPDSEETDMREAPEIPEVTHQRGGRDAGIQAWAEYASQAAACKPLGQVGAFQSAGGVMASLAAQASGHCQPANQPAQAAQHQPDAAGMGMAALQYPEALNAEELAQAPRKLDGLHPTMAQEVLDALAAKIAAGGVKSHIGLLVYLAKSAREGTFDRTLALEWRKRGQVVQVSVLVGLKAELRGLASEITAYQNLLKASNGADTATGAKVDAMKAEWYQKSATCRALETAQEAVHG